MLTLVTNLLQFTDVFGKSGGFPLLFAQILSRVLVTILCTDPLSWTVTTSDSELYLAPIDLDPEMQNAFSENRIQQSHLYNPVMSFGDYRQVIMLLVLIWSYSDSIRYVHLFFNNQVTRYVR